MRSAAALLYPSAAVLQSREADMATEFEDPFAWPDLPLEKIFEVQDRFKFMHALVGSLYLRLERSRTDSWNLFNPSERALLAIWELKGEVDNGGFAQYFYNDSALHAGEAASALELVGAVHTAELVRKALAVFPGGAPSMNGDTRDRQLEVLRPKSSTLWKSLSAEFYKDPDGLENTVFTYCHQHRGVFGTK
jgi:hypothetical protein